MNNNPQYTNQDIISLYSKINTLAPTLLAISTKNMSTGTGLFLDPNYISLLTTFQLGVPHPAGLAKFTAATNWEKTYLTIWDWEFYDALEALYSDVKKLTQNQLSTYGPSSVAKLLEGVGSISILNVLYGIPLMMAKPTKTLTQWQWTPVLVGDYDAFINDPPEDAKQIIKDIDETYPAEFHADWMCPLLKLKDFIIALGIEIAALKLKFPDFSGIDLGGELSLALKSIELKLQKIKLEMPQIPKFELGEIDNLLKDFNLKFPEIKLPKIPELTLPKMPEFNSPEFEFKWIIDQMKIMLPQIPKFVIDMDLAFMPPAIQILMKKLKLTLPKMPNLDISLLNLPSIVSDLVLKISLDLKLATLKMAGFAKDLKGLIPNFDVPDVNLPDFKLPDISMSKIGEILTKIKKLNLPDIDLSGFNIPDFNLPDFKLPSASVPKLGKILTKIKKLNLPDIDLPDFNIPDFKIPDINLPKISALMLKIKDLDLPEFDLKKFLPELPDNIIKMLLDVNLPNIELPDLNFKLIIKEIKKSIPEFDIDWDYFLRDCDPYPKTDLFNGKEFKILNLRFVNIQF